MIIQRHLACLFFGNFCYLLRAKEIQVNRSGLKLVCSDNILLLCSSSATPDCIDTSLCKMEEQRQKNETRRDLFISLREALCNPISSNYSLNNGNSRNHFLEHQNTTDILKLTDCWRYNSKWTNYTPELICIIGVFLSIMIMFFSYIYLKKTLTKYLSRRQKALLYVRPNQRSNVELL